jgi:hypothetical protein
MQVERPSFKAQLSGVGHQGSGKQPDPCWLSTDPCALMEGSGRRESNTWERTLWFGTTQGNLG